MANANRVRPLWNIRESKTASAQLDQLAGLHPRFQHMWEGGASWLIRRDPLALGQVVPGYQNTRAFKVKDFLAIGLPEVVVTYSIIDSEAIIEIVSVLHLTAANPLAQAV
jgi:hypothetical protein